MRLKKKKRKEKGKKRKRKRNYKKKEKHCGFVTGVIPKGDKDLFDRRKLVIWEAVLSYDYAAALVGIKGVCVRAQFEWIWRSSSKANRPVP